jgi:hypothetical protein
MTRSWSGNAKVSGGQPELLSRGTIKPADTNIHLRLSGKLGFSIYSPSLLGIFSTRPSKAFSKIHNHNHKGGSHAGIDTLSSDGISPKNDRQTGYLKTKRSLSFQPA